MSSPTDVVAEVLVADATYDEDVGEMVDWLAATGVSARTRRTKPHRDPDIVAWVFLVVLPLQAFLTALGTAAADDLTAIVKRLAHGWASRRGGGQGGRPRPLVLQDAVTGVRVVIEAGLPVEAYEKLLKLDVSSFRQGPVHYDRALRRWRSELDESEGGPSAG
jgi:hypothetical protein